MIKYLSEHPGLVNHNPFWAALADHLINNNGEFASFVTTLFTLSTSNINEIAFSLAFMDLPFANESHGFKASSGRGVEIKAASNMVIFLKEIQETESDLNKDLLVVHRYFEHGKSDKEVDEFLINERYTCQVVVANISSKSISFSALTQVPQGSLPLQKSHYQKSRNHSLGPFQTTTLEFYFYFPETGKYKHFPTNIAIDRKVVAKAQANVLEVKKV